MDGGEHQRGQLDPPRLLSRRSEFAYVDRPAMAMPGEPEAVSATVQAQLTARSRRDARQRQRAAWQACRAGIIESVTTFEASTRLDRSVSSALRVIQRTIAQVDARVASD